MVTYRASGQLHVTTQRESDHSTRRQQLVTAVLCAAFDPATDEAIYAVRDQVRALGVALPGRPPHRPHLTLTAARVTRGDELHRVVETVHEIVARHEPVPIVLHEVGRFGRAGVLWLGPARNHGLPALQRDAYRTMKARWSPAFGERSSPNLWVPHCTLATRIAKPRLREIEEAIAAAYTPISGWVAAVATIFVGGQGDIALAPL